MSSVAQRRNGDFVFPGGLLVAYAFAQRGHAETLSEEREKTEGCDAHTHPFVMCELQKNEGMIDVIEIFVSISCPSLPHHVGGALSVGLERGHCGDAEKDDHEDAGELDHLDFVWFACSNKYKQRALRVVVCVLRWDDAGVVPPTPFLRSYVDDFRDFDDIPVFLATGGREVKKKTKMKKVGITKVIPAAVLVLVKAHETPAYEKRDSS